MRRHRHNCDVPVTGICKLAMEARQVSCISKQVSDAGSFGIMPVQQCSPPQVFFPKIHPLPACNNEHVAFPVFPSTASSLLSHSKCFLVSFTLYCCITEILTCSHLLPSLLLTPVPLRHTTDTRDSFVHQMGVHASQSGSSQCTPASQQGM